MLSKVQCGGLLSAQASQSRKQTEAWKWTLAGCSFTKLKKRKFGLWMLFDWMIFCLNNWPVNNVGAEELALQGWKSVSNFWPPQTHTNSLVLTGSLTNNKQLMTTFIMSCMYDILCSDHTVSQRRECISHGVQRSAVHTATERNWARGLPALTPVVRVPSAGHPAGSRQRGAGLAAAGADGAAAGARAPAHAGEGRQGAAGPAVAHPLHLAQSDGESTRQEATNRRVTACFLKHQFRKPP